MTTNSKLVSIVEGLPFEPPAPPASPNRLITSGPAPKINSLLLDYFDEGDSDDYNIYDVKSGFALEIDGVDASSVGVDGSGDIAVFYSEYDGTTPIGPGTTFKLFSV